MSLGDLPRGLRRVPRLMGGAVAGQGSDAADAPPAAPTFYTIVIVADATSKQALPDNPRRAYLLIQNRGASDVYVSFGSKAETSGLVIAANGGAYEPFVTPGSSVHVVTASGSSNLVFVEGAQP